MTAKPEAFPTGPWKWDSETDFVPSTAYCLSDANGKEIIRADSVGWGGDFSVHIELTSEIGARLILEAPQMFELIRDIAQRGWQNFPKTTATENRAIAIVNKVLGK